MYSQLKSFQGICFFNICHPILIFFIHNTPDFDSFAREGCRMVESSSAENDWRAAGSQFITHTMGRVLGKLGLESTPVNAKGYETLIKLVENAAEDSFDLYYGLYQQLERSDLGFKSLKKQLFGLLHDVLRKQLFENAEKSQFFSEETSVSKASQNAAVLASSLEILTLCLDRKKENNERKI
ncbi:arogenate dehydrogenase 2, chloroplastic [Hevea brasiliensis]|uniref:arogenate dehydrogenase 2, chloroplastic n=1 Tax=Hevea brasiliensis TaxID=3981 RepID=UPI0025FFCE51|nr:arogenate dehydrogenase 2, chloroplastic [Hevea brasiliensis]